MNIRRRKKREKNGIKRQSNFELLRIISMFMIVSMHFVSQSNVAAQIGGFNFIFTQLISSCARICVNIFLMIGAWFLVDSNFSAKRILKMYSELWFYCAGITIFLIICGKNISLRGILNGFFPMMRGSCWFVPVYIELLLFVPFLQKVLKWKKTTLDLFIPMLFIFSSVISTIHKYSESYFDWFMWFCCIFFFIGYYKKYYSSVSSPFKRKISKYCALVIALFLYFLLVSLKSDVVMKFYPSKSAFPLSKLADQYLSDCKSLPNLGISFLIFHYFQNIDLGNNRIINKFSRSTLAVYLISQSPNLINYIWVDCQKLWFWKSGFYIFNFLLTVLIIFVASEIIDSIRIYFIEPIWTHSKYFKKVENRLNYIYKKVENLSITC